MAGWLFSEIKTWARALARASSVLLLATGVWWYSSTFAAESLLHTDAVSGPFFLSSWTLGVVTVLHVWRIYGMPTRRWFWEHGFVSQFRGFPHWFPYCWVILFSLIGIHFALLVSDRKPGIATFVNGVYVLQFRGQLHELFMEQEISKTQYFAERAAEIRLQAVFVLAFACFSFVYWWFGKGSNAPATDLIEIE